MKTDHRLGLAIALGTAWFAQAEPRSTEDASDVVNRHVAAKVRRDQAFRLRDPQSGGRLELLPDEVRSVRRLPGTGFIVEVLMHERADPARVYDLDFWLTEATLEVLDVRIHKGPVRDGKGWTLTARSPLLWWWRCSGSCSKTCFPEAQLPIAPGKARGWQVESTVHLHLATHGKDDVFLLEDEAGRGVRALEVVEMHRPPRAVPGKGYVMCVELADPADRQQRYDVDLWVAERDGALEINRVRLHKTPRQQNGVWTQVPLYELGDDLHEVW